MQASTQANMKACRHVSMQACKHAGLNACKRERLHTYYRSTYFFTKLLIDPQYKSKYVLKSN